MKPPSLQAANLFHFSDRNKRGAIFEFARCLPLLFRISISLHYFVLQRLVAFYHIEFYVGVPECLEVFACVVDDALLVFAQLEGFHGAFCFGDEIDILELRGVEHDRPVGVVVPERGRDAETSRELPIEKFLDVP